MAEITTQKRDEGTRKIFGERFYAMWAASNLSEEAYMEKTGLKRGIFQKYKRPGVHGVFKGRFNGVAAKLSMTPDELFALIGATPEEVRAAKGDAPEDDEDEEIADSLRAILAASGAHQSAAVAAVDAPLDQRLSFARVLLPEATINVTALQPLPRPGDAPPAAPVTSPPKKPSGAGGAGPEPFRLPPHVQESIVPEPPAPPAPPKRKPKGKAG